MSKSMPLLQIFKKKKSDLEYEQKSDIKKRDKPISRALSATFGSEIKQDIQQLLMHFG